MSTYRLADPDCVFPYKTEVKEMHFGLRTIYLCTRDYLNKVLREAFENRVSVTIHHKPEREESFRLYKTYGGMIWEGLKVSSWTSGFDGSSIGCTFEGKSIAFPLNEIQEVMV